MENIDGDVYDRNDDNDTDEDKIDDTVENHFGEDDHNKNDEEKV
ncbi:19156_t:CDS:1, partial [Funneliformis geosporum]